MKITYTVLTFLGILAYTIAQKTECPSSCICYHQNGEVVVEARSRLYAIPGPLPEGTTKINFSFNHIEEIKDRDLRNLTSLKYLILNSNHISKIHENAFLHLTSLEELDLKNNSIEELPEDVFQMQHKLTTLDLSTNRISELGENVFASLVALEYLNLNTNKITYSRKDGALFTNIKKLRYFGTESFFLKCLARTTSTKLPLAKIGMFADCDSLLRDHQYRILVWIFGLSALLGNVWVIVYWLWVARKLRGKRAEKARVQSFLVMNLAVSDLLMGVYLLIIAVLDTEWEGRYFKYDALWRSSSACKLAGILCMISSEASVLMLVTITADRLNCIVYHIKAKRFSIFFARIVSVVIWLLTILISSIPIIPTNYFYSKDKKISMYGVTPVCLPLQLSKMSFGWEYIFAIYIVFNGLAFLFILIAYIVIFVKVRVSSKVSNSSIKRESLLARRVVWVVLTDFCCWFPVIVMGCLTLSDKRLLTENASWLALVVLPINSSINPILYTFSNQQFRNFFLDVFTCKKLLGEKNRVLCNNANKGAEPADVNKQVPNSTGLQPLQIQQDDGDDTTSAKEKNVGQEACAEIIHQSEV